MFNLDKWNKMLYQYICNYAVAPDRDIKDYQTGVLVMNKYNVKKAFIDSIRNIKACCDDPAVVSAIDAQLNRFTLAKKMVASQQDPDTLD